MIKVVVANMPTFQKELKKASEKVRKAEFTAVRVAGFALMKQLKAEMRKGAPGGQALKGLGFIRKKELGRNRKPLSTLNKMIRYKASNRDNKLKTELGFLSSGRGAIKEGWRKILNLHQEGGVKTVTAPMKWAFVKRAIYLQGQGRKNTHPGFFLRRSTSKLIVPARPIIDPFWAANQTKALQMIRDNFVRKMRGERI